MSVVQAEPIREFRVSREQTRSGPDLTEMTNQTRVPPGLAAYLFALGLAAAVTTALFILALLSYDNASRRLFSSNEGVAERNSTVQLSLPSDNYSGHVPVRTASARVPIKAKDLGPSKAAPSYPSTFPEAAILPDSANAATSAEEVELRPIPGQAALDGLPGQRQSVVSSPIVITEPSATVLSTGIPDRESAQILREPGVQQERTGGLNEGNSALLETKPAERTRAGNIDHPHPGFSSSFLYRVARECGPMHDRQLYRYCVASFGVRNRKP